MLYFLNQQGDGVTRAQIEAAGLTYAIDGGVSCRGSGGPDGQRGKLIAADGLDRQLRYDAGGQVWKRIGDLVPDHPAAEAWVGYDPLRPPTPQWLARDNQLDGHPVTLGDGREWLVPKARYFSEADGRLQWQTALPRPITGFDGRAFLVGEAPPQFAKLAEYTDAYVDESCPADDDDDDTPAEGRTILRDLGRLMRGAAEALSINYRVSLAEVLLLGLIHDRTDMLIRIHEAMSDGPGLAALQKKNTAHAGCDS